VLRVIKDNANTLTVTLTEKATVSNPIYLFKFTNQTSNVAYWFISSDTSQFKQRYNKFLLTEKNNANTLNGEITLGLEGRYDYEIYQTNLANTSGLSSASDAIENIVKTVEVGIVDVVFDVKEYAKYEVQYDTNIVYQPDPLNNNFTYILPFILT
jgi:hypothetical protein